MLDLADEAEDVTDALLLIRRRLAHAQFIMPPTVGHELAADARQIGNQEDQQRALRAFRLARDWDIRPTDLLAVGHGIAEQIGRRLRETGLLPEEEVNDSLIAAETALLGATLLLPGDEHLRGMDFQRLTFELRSFDVAVPVIATPREIVRKFFA